MQDALNSLITIFIMALPGVVFGKKQFITSEQVKGMSSFMMKIVLPVLIINSMQMEFSKEIFKDSISVFFIVFAVFAVVFVIGIILVKALRLDNVERGLIIFILFFANTGGIGLPIIGMLYGEEAVFYAGIVEMAVDVLIFTVGIILIQWSGKYKKGMSVKNLVNPGTLGIVIGYSMFLFGIKLPETVYTAFEKIGSANLPLAMFVIGYQLGITRFSEIFGDIRAYIIATVKMAVIPAIVYIMARYIFRMDILLSSVITILLAMPTGSAAAIFAEEYNANVKLAAKSILITTILSPLSIAALVIIF